MKAWKLSLVFLEGLLFICEMRKSKYTFLALGAPNGISHSFLDSVPGFQVILRRLKRRKLKQEKYSASY